MIEDMKKISVEPQISTLQLHRLDRALSRVVSMSSVDVPDNDVEADLAGDVFHSLHREPDMRSDVPEGREVNSSLVDWMKSRTSWDEAATACGGNVAASLTAGNIMWQAMRTDEAIKEALERQAKADTARQKAEAAEIVANAMKDAGLNEDDAAKEKEFSEYASEMRGEARSLQDDANQYTQGLTENRLSSSTMSSTIGKATKAAEEVNAAMSGWGHGPGSPLRNSTKDSLRFLAKNNERLAKIAKLAGRMRGISFEARRQKTILGVEPTDIDYSRDFKRIFPTELALLSPNAPHGIRELQAAKFAEIGLASWVYTGSAEESGPFICMIDESGSMAGGPEMVAKGMGLGLAQVAKTENRQYALVAFASDSDPTRHVYSDSDWEQHLDWAEQFISGGTSFNKALTTAMHEVMDMQKPKDADIVFISDGIARISDEVLSEWKKFTKEHGVRLIYVAVGHSAAGSQIAEFADQIVEVASLTTEAGDELSRHLGQWMR